MQDISVAVNDIVPKSEVCLNRKMESKLTMIMIGAIILLFFVCVYYLYRFVKKVNSRFHSLEDVLSKLVEKTNQLQAFVQSSPPFPRHNVVQQQPQYVQQHPPPQSPPPHYPPVQSQTPPVQVEQNLDKELAEELQELNSPTPQSTDDDKEGRIDDVKP